MRQILAIGLLLSLSGCQSDVVTSRYATVQEAEADHLFERGWLPDLLPTSTKRIRTRNNLDLNTSEGEFYFEPADSNALFSKLSKGAPTPGHFVRWDEVVDSYVRRGYSTWSYLNENSTWAFFCNDVKGHCDYIMWLRQRAA